MNAGFGAGRIRWTQFFWASLGSGLLVACAEPTTVDPSKVPEAAVDVGSETSDADPDARDGSTGGTGGSGGSGGSGGGGTGGASGAAGGPSDAGDAGDASDVADGNADALRDALPDAPASDTGPRPDADATLPDTGGPADVTSDPTSDPTLDTGRDGDAPVDATGDRAG